jgi:hypothetical protein
MSSLINSMEIPVIYGDVYGEQSGKITEWAYTSTSSSGYVILETPDGARDAIHIANLVHNESNPYEKTYSESLMNGGSITTTFTLSWEHTTYGGYDYFYVISGTVKCTGELPVGSTANAYIGYSLYGDTFNYTKEVTLNLVGAK